MKDYYKILGVSSTATDEDIKKAYRLLAKRYHPDINPDSAIAAAKFRDITEAYDVLSVAEKRHQYDATVARTAQQQQPQQASQSKSNSSSYAFKSDPLAAAAQAAAQAAAKAAAKANENAQASYLKGYQTGFSDAKKGSENEAAKYKNEIDSLKEKNEALNEIIDSLNDKIENVDAESSILKDENAWLDRELKRKEANLEALKKYIRDTAGASAVKRAESEAAIAAQCDTQSSRSELKNALAQAELQHQKRVQAEEAVKKLQRRVDELVAENESLKRTVEQWEEYAKGEDFISDMEKLRRQWDTKIKNDKKRAKNTIYGSLGVMIWADEQEITASYKKLVARYQKKTATDAKARDKLFEINDAYKVLSDPQRRAEYNASIGVDNEEFDKEREQYKEYKEFIERYNTEMEQKEFWEFVDELMYNAQTGDAEAQNTLGEMYYYGDELEQDLEQAVYWFKEGAKQGHAECLYNLGICFINGEGVPCDEMKGWGFMRQAEKNGSESAINYVSQNKPK